MDLSDICINVASGISSMAWAGRLLTTLAAGDALPSLGGPSARAKLFDCRKRLPPSGSDGIRTPKQLTRIVPKDTSPTWPLSPPADPPSGGQSGSFREDGVERVILCCALQLEIRRAAAQSGVGGSTASATRWRPLP